jgi:hypothetical protein
MRRYTVILSDHSGYADYHVLAKDRKAAEAKAVALNCCTDSDDEREERVSNRSHQPETIFIFSGWDKHARG